MRILNRREMCVALSAFAMLGAESTVKGEDKENAEKENVLSRSKTFAYDRLPVTKLPNGATVRKVISGVLVTGETIEVHESTLPPGQMPHSPHRHRNSELLFIRDGRLEYLNNGTPEMVGPGDVVFTASNILHGLKNTGDVEAKYFVIAIGRTTAK